jgi:ABC-type glycerol-3-phosphate transport system substrate-binding protein
MGKAAVGVAAVVIVGGVAYYASTQAAPAPTTVTAAPTTVTLTQPATTVSTVTTATPTTITSVQPTTTVTTVTTETTVTPTSTPTVAPKPEKLDWYQWVFMPPVVKVALDKFTDDTGIPVEQHVLPRVGFETAMQTKIMGGTPVDTMYIGIGYRNKWYNAGWVLGVDDLPEADKVKRDIIPDLLPYYTQDGLLVAMPYYAAGWFPFYNKRMLEGIGAEPATSREEVYEQCKKAKAKYGLTAAYHSCWLQGTEWLWEQYVIEDNLVPFDESNKPLFEGDPRNTEALKWMKKMYQEELTARTIFTDGWDVQALNLAKGNSLYCDTHQYTAEGVNRSMTGDIPERGNIALAAKPIGPGKLYYSGEWFGVTKNTRSREWAWELSKYCGWKVEGKYILPEEFGKGIGLCYPYSGWWEDPAVATAFNEWVDWDLMKGFFEKNMITPTWQFIPWFADWMVFTALTIQKYVIGEMTLSDCESQMADRAKELQAEIS